MAQLIVVPLQLFEDHGAEAFGRAIDAAAADGESGFAENVATPAAVETFLQQRRDALLAFGEAVAARGPGLIYIHDRLDQPPLTNIFESWVAPHAAREIGGYTAVYLERATVAGLAPSIKSPALATIDRYSSASSVVVHCRIAHAVDPDRLDQPCLAVVKGDQVEASAPAKTPRGKGRSNV